MIPLWMQAEEMAQKGCRTEQKQLFEWHRKSIIVRNFELNACYGHNRTLY